MGFSASGISSHAEISAWRGVRRQSAGTTPSAFCRAMVSSRSLSQPRVELALVLVGPLLGHMVWRVGGTRREVDEERFIGYERLLLRDPSHRLVGHVRHEVVAFFRRLPRLDRHGALV